MRCKWKKEEKEMLRQGLLDGVQPAEIAIPGRKYEGIRRQARKLGLIAPSRNNGLTDEQKTKLQQLRRQGFLLRQIASDDLLGQPTHTVYAIQKACSRMGLVNENRSRAAKERKVWLDGEKEEFFDFLRRHSEELAPEQIAEKFGLKKVTVFKWQKFLRVKPTLQDTLALPYIQEKFRRAYHQKSQKMLADFDEKIAERQKELEALFQKMRKKERDPPFEERRCAGCGHLWLRHRRFFFHATTREKGLTCWHFERFCKICVAKKRHEKKLMEHQKKYHQ